MLIGGAFYLVGTDGITKLFGGTISELLRAIGTGSRFESIERGVIDLRDLIYYLSLTTLFLALNVMSLDVKRWSKGERTAGHRWNAILRVILVAANLLTLNAWLYPMNRLRADLTAHREYSLSPVTRELVSNLSEPMLIRGYFSERTHPLLSPLAPTLRDLLEEYEIASNGKITVEIVDPQDDEDIETEANQVYGIQATPFRISDRYEESVINSYFDILIRYGDQNVVLGYNDLIEVVAAGGGDYDVSLRNPEYDITRSIKKVVYGFQSLDAVFASLEDPVRLTAVVTPNTLPAEFSGVMGNIEQVAGELADEADGNFVYSTFDPDAADAPYTRQELYENYGLRPFAVSLFSQDTYYLHLMLQIGDETMVTYPTGDMTAAEIRTDIEAALKRAAPGFLKTVGVWNPSEEQIQDPFYGTAMDPISTWGMMRQQLAQDYTVKQVDLSTGRVPGDVDVLVVVGPESFTDAEVFAVDQFLMRGGSLIVATGNYYIAPMQMSAGLTMAPVESGLHDLLAHYGVTIGAGMVMDPQNEPFPMQIPRTVGGMTIYEIQQINYPYFVDIRNEAMSEDSPIVSSLPAVTLQWVSPLQIDETKNAEREVVTLLQSTDGSWIRDETDVQPDLDQYPEYGFAVEGAQYARPLAISIRGSFESYFKDKESPFATGQTPEGDEITEEQAQVLAQGTIEQSPESTRLVVIGSSEFLDDAVLQISASQSAERYLNNLQLLQNTVDWSVEDEDLLTIRSRGASARILNPLTTSEQSFWEGLNYAVALIGLIAIGFVWSSRRRNEEPMQLVDATHSEAVKEGK